MSRAVALGLLLVTAVLLQTALFPHLAIAGFRPDLLLLVTIALALDGRPSTALKVGFVAGLLADLLMDQGPVGLSALVLLAVGYGVSLARPYLAPDSVSAPLVMVLVASLAGTAGYGVLSRLLGDPRFTGWMILETSVVVALYNTLLAPLVTVAVRRLRRAFPAEAVRW